MCVFYPTCPLSYKILLAFGLRRAASSRLCTCGCFCVCVCGSVWVRVFLCAGSLCVLVSVQIKCEYMRNVNNFKTLLLGAYSPSDRYYLRFVELGFFFWFAGSLSVHPEWVRQWFGPVSFAIHHILFEVRRNHFIRYAHNSHTSTRAHEHSHKLTREHTHTRATRFIYREKSFL